MEKTTSPSLGQSSKSTNSGSKQVERIGFPHKPQIWKPGQSGNPKGKPKGAKHISTWIQELMEDEEFETQIHAGYKIIDFKGAPIKAIIQAQMRKAMNGDTKAFDSLGKYGWSQKVEHSGEQKLIVETRTHDANNQD